MSNATSNVAWRRSLQKVSMGVITMSGVALIAGSSLIAQQPVAAAQAQGRAAADELLARRVTIHVTDVSLKRAIDSVARLAHVVVEYQLPLIQANTQQVTVNVTAKPLGVVLEQILSGTALRVVPGGSASLTIVPVSESVADSIPSEGTVSGRIADSATGRGLSGVTVKVVGSKLSTMTQDSSGRFTLTHVPAGQRVVMFRVFGYRPADRTVEVTAAQTTPIRVSLVPAPNVLSNVITTATGQQRKVEVGNDITTLNVDSLQSVAPISSVTDLLATRVPGLTVMHSSGTPGDPSRLRLRGAGSVQLNNDPIVIVDGIRVYASQSDPRNANLAPIQKGGVLRVAQKYTAPSPLDQIDPNSIETIEVMKGPSASAIYGSDAANGVIIITTKRGRAGKTQWLLNLSNGVNWIPGTWPTNYYRFGVSDRNRGPVCPWSDPSCLIDSVVAFQALNDPRYSVFAHGSDRQANLSVSGGVPTLIYSVTGSTQSTGGNLKLPGSEIQRYDSLYGPIPHALVRPDQYTTWGVSGSLTAVPGPALTATFQSSLFTSAQRQSSLATAITQLSRYYVSPTFVYDASANLRVTGSLISDEYERVTSDQQTSNNSVDLRWQPHSWLPMITGNAGVSTGQKTDVSYVPFGVLQGGDTTGSYGLGRGTTRTSTLNVRTEIPMFRQKIMTSVGSNFTSATTADLETYTDQLAPGVSTPTSFTQLCANSVLCNGPSSQLSSAQNTYRWYLSPQLNAGNKFFANPGFTLNGGSGGSSISSSGLSGLSGFPKVDLSYVAVDRQDAPPLWGLFSLVRPRLAYGYAGTQPSPQDKLRLYNVGGYKISAPGNGNTTAAPNSITGAGGCSSVGTLDGVTSVYAVCLNALGNTQLHPERSSELEGGADLGLWRNRVSLTYTFYNKTRHDAVVPVPVAPSVYVNGISPFLIQKNIGNIRNTGGEGTLTATVLDRSLLSWTVNANVSRNTSRVVRLNPGQLPIVFSGDDKSYLETRAQAGFPLFGFFARPIVSYADANQDGIIEPGEIRYGDSVVYVGQSAPNYEAAFSNDLAFFNRRLSVHAAFAYTNGLTQLNEGACSSGALASLLNTPGGSLAEQAAVVAANCSGSNSGFYPNTATSAIGILQTVNTFRFQSMSINAVVPDAITRRLRVPHMFVALQGENLWLHTNYRGKDPDVNAFSTVSAGDQTIDSGQIPQPRTVLLRITVQN